MEGIAPTAAGPFVGGTAPVLCNRFTKRGGFYVETVTIKDIARMAGVSCATVSRVLNGSLTVTPALRERILDLCRRHGYRRNLLARGLSAGRTNLMGCVLSDLDNPLFADMALALERCLRLRGYHLFLCRGRVEDGGIGQLFEFLIGHRVDGILLASSSKQAPELIRRYTGYIPIVLQGDLSASGPDLDIPSVCVDSEAGGRMAAEYLFRLGHVRVAYLGARENNSSHLARQRGFLEAADRLGMSVRTLFNDGASSTMEAGCRLARRFFLDPFRETAVFAACDTIALGVMSAAREFHISIPEDISLLGFDNIRYAGFPRIRLTTLDHRIRQVTETAADRLLTCIQRPEAAPVQPVVIPPVLVERGTCKPRL